MVFYFALVDVDQEESGKDDEARRSHGNGWNSHYVIGGLGRNGQEEVTK